MSESVCVSALRIEHETLHMLVSALPLRHSLSRVHHFSEHISNRLTSPNNVFNKVYENIS